ncbi:MAG: hypothetical protein WAX14_10910 [Rhodococcus sp. (in: high G+C Gram-positive bacteria)]|uniref:hypothetical protein n=1 Tax=Rhodococcus sp. TaxID=1831 RepID=UPI003BB5B9A9
MPGGVVEPQIRALAFMISQRNLDIPDKPSLSFLQGLLKKYNDLKKGSGVPYSTATLSRKFRLDSEGLSVDPALMVLRETQDYLIATKGFVPPKLIDCIARMTADGQKSDEHARSWSANAPVDLLRQVAEDAEKNRDLETAAKARCHIAIRMTRPDVPGDRYEAIKSALEHATQGHKLATGIPEKERSGGVKESAAGCARTAAWALVQLYRLDVSSDVESDGLARRLDDLIDWKGHEVAAEKLLGRPVAAALAEFHQTRAQALAEYDAHREIHAFAAVAGVLIGKKADDGTWSAVHGQIWWHELNAIITRLCALDWAYADDPDHSRGYRRAFPERIDPIVTELMTIYDDDEAGKRAKRRAQAIVNLKKHTEELEKAYATDPDDLDVIRCLVSKVEIDEFLHASEATGLTAIGLSRYAIAVADLAAADRLPHRRLDPYSLLSTAQDICLRARSGTHDRTFGRFIQARIAYYLHEIEQRLSTVANCSAESEDENREGVEHLSEDDDDGHPESYAAAVKELMDELAITTLIEARAEGGNQLKEAQATIRNIAESVCRFIGELVDEPLDHLMGGENLRP